MKVTFNQVGMYPDPAQKLNLPDRRKMSKMSNNEDSIVFWKQKNPVDKISFASNAGTKINYMA
jgi:hypothetical protein